MTDWKLINMALAPRDMDGFLPLLITTDTKQKLTIANNLINYLGDPDNSIECGDIGQFIDSLIPWMQSSNNKVSQNGIDAMTYLVDRMGMDFRPYISTVLPPIIDRLGDSKEMVREKSQLLILKLMERDVITPQTLFDKLMPSFSHKNGKIREEVLHCLTTTLTEHGAQSLAVSRLVPCIVKLLSDPMASVRDTAFTTLVEVYRHVGERLRTDLQKKHSVPASKLPTLMARFDELRLGGDMLPSALTGDGGRGDDETDSVIKSAGKRASSVPRRGATATTTKSVPTTPAPGPKVRRTSSLRRTGSSSGQAGAVDEETFSRAFEDVPTVQLFSARELEEQLVAIREIIADPSKDWNKRVDALKKVRSLLIAGASNYDELHTHLRLLEPPFQTSVKDLRSQVVREACYTIAYLSEQLGHKCDHFAEYLLNSLINLIQNSAKVMASAGVVTVRFIIRYTHYPRLIPIIATNLNSKSKDIRRACCEFLEQLLHSWSSHALERHAGILQEAVKKGISDANPEARLCARKAYWSFRSHFPDHAEALLNSLDSTYKRALNGELTLSNSSSSNSLHHQGSTTSRYGSGGTTPRQRLPSSATGSTENLHQYQQGPPHGLLHRTPSLTRHHRSGIPVLTATAGAKGGDADGPGSPRRPGCSPGPSALRSNSAIDLQAAQRAKARAQYAAMARHKVGSGASLRDDHGQARPRKPSDPGNMTTSAITSPERVGRTRSRVAGVSQSQPSSRSGSPSSRLSYATYNTARGSVSGEADSPVVGRPRRLSGIPRSTGTSREASRETSPSRYMGVHDRSFGSKLGRRPLHSMGSTERPPQATRPVMAQKILQQSREAESALADALNFDSLDSGDYSRVTNSRKAYRPFDDHSDDSETSSVCSERSFDSYRRPSDSYSWSGSQQRLYRDVLEPVHKDISEIIANCASTHWADRKEGLVGLQGYLQSGRLLSGSELKRVTEIFTKMFMDSHTKVFSLFLDTLTELLQAHKADLLDWLYILLTRLLNKLGADLLGSIQSKIHKSLAIVRDSFPPELQLGVVMRFLVDQTQTPNSKVKVAVLTFLAQLAAITDPAAFSPGPRDLTPAALAKIISWMGDAKSADIRKAAQNAVIALFNLNTPQVTMILADLPTEYQEAASSLVQNHLRRSSCGSSPPSPSLTPASPRLQSPGTPQNTRPPRGALELDDEHLNPEEVYRSLRRTTAEIQNYSFGELGPGKLLDRDRDTTSQDSGISQMSAGPGDKLDTLEEQFEAMSITRNNSGRSSSLSSPTHRLNSLRDYNGLDKSVVDGSLTGENGFIPRESHHQEDSEAVRKVIETLRLSEAGGERPVVEVSETERKLALTQLIRLVKEGSTMAIMENFKMLLRVLLEQLALSDASTKAQVLAVLTEMFKRRTMAPCFQHYVELLVLKVLQSNKESSKEVARAAEACAATMGTVLPPDVVIRVLNPLITTGEFPVNLAAIKMLTKLVEQKPREVVEPHLGDVMPALIKAYDNSESPVRKSAVFCMVALHAAVGEAGLQPHLDALSGSKLKLLHLYIKRAQQGSSVPTSPKNAPP